MLTLSLKNREITASPKAPAVPELHPSQPSCGANRTFYGARDKASTSRAARILQAQKILFFVHQCYCNAIKPCMAGLKFSTTKVLCPWAGGCHLLPSKRSGQFWRGLARCCHCHCQMTTPDISGHYKLFKH